MNNIGDLLTRDLRRKIEEIIQVHQADEEAVYSEITEYIATDSIRDQYAQVFRAVAEAPAEPHEGIGVWISGFFGSGKSSFAKNLGYALQNGQVLGHDFSSLFKRQIEDDRIANLLDSINTRIPTEVILFEVAKERDTRKVTERIAELILKYNLHGVDIDRRATQIAALTLWLRCQRAFAEAGLKEDRPKITRANIVCAEPMPGENEMLNEFTSHLEPQVLGDLVEAVFDKMKLAGEAGTLLRIEEDVRELVSKRKSEYLKELQRQRTDAEYFPGMAPPREPSLFDDMDMPNKEFWNRAESDILKALRRYADQARDNGLLRHRLFEQDTAGGFAFIDLCQKQFDVVLMNPPFGDPSKPSKKYIDLKYPRTKNDVYAAFVERWLNKLEPGGMLGAITSRTGFFLSSFKKWREEILLEEARPTVFADLGYGVLDTAMVETAAYCLETKGQEAMK